jgi:hypothetical protein
MGKAKGSQGAEGQAPVLTLKMDSQTKEPVEVTPDGEPAFLTPCSITGLGAGLSGGTVGYVLGFGKACLQSSGLEKVHEVACIFWHQHA